MHRSWLAGIVLALSVCAVAPAQGSLAWLSRDLLEPRSRFGLADDPVRRRLVLFGGESLQGGTWEWDGRRWVRRLATPSPGGRAGTAMVWDGARRRIVLFGGFDGIAELRDTWTYDGTAWRAASPAQSPPARSDHLMAYDASRDRVVLFGGTAGGQPLGDTWELDGSTWLRRTPPRSPPAQGDAAVAYDAARQRVVVFGTTAAGTAGTWTWDGTTWTDVTPASSPGRAGGQRMAYHPPSRRVVLFGGRPSARVASRTWLWDGSAWQPSATAGPANAYHGMSWSSASEAVVLFGGDSGLAATWAWDGASWTERPGPTGIPAMIEPAIAYDGSRGRLVVFGDGGGRNSRSTWEWDGVAWERVADLGAFGPYAPIPGSGHRMVYDSTRQRVILYGGYRGSPSAGSTDTYEWDGRLWIHANTTARPSFGTRVGMAYDAARQRVVVFGGSLTRAETWEFDGSDWALATPMVSPGPRVNPAMAYDAARRKTVLFGGGDASGVLLDTWEWDGTNWTAFAPTTSPPAGGSMVYDAARQRTVLLEDTPARRTWEWNGADWSVSGAPSPVSSDLAAYDGRENALFLLADSAEGAPVTWARKATTPASVERYGAGCSGAARAPELMAFGLPVIGSRSFALDVAPTRPFAPVAYFVSAGAASAAIGPCTVLVDPGRSVPIPATANGGGFASVRIPIPAGARWVGASLFAQAAALDAQATLGFSLTAGAMLAVGE